MKATDPDTESESVSIAGFRNCGDDVPVSLAINATINATDAISLPTALRKRVFTQARALGRIASKVATMLVMTLSRAFGSVAESRECPSGDSELRPGALTRRVWRNAIRRLNFTHGTWRAENDLDAVAAHSNFKPSNRAAGAARLRLNHSKL